MSSPSKEETTENHETLTKEDTETSQPKEEEEEVNSSLENQHDTNHQDNASLWTAVWDDNAQAYYWWNTETNETTWINPEQPVYDTTTTTTAAAAVVTSHNPLDSILDKIDTDVKKQLDGKEAPVPVNQESYEHYFDDQPEPSYTTTAHFNARTGRFTTQEDLNRLNPEHLTIENRATRQMQNFFDVDRYTEERNMQRASYTADGRIAKKKHLSRKEVEYFKKMKKEKKSKKAREWLMQ
ncbi:hypothetical protein BD770DRAFT_383970 [Pilaira anomala]|nr:hypothetical protein BD770DRAFT_383970 [Pilaira anomala]